MKGVVRVCQIGHRRFNAFGSGEPPLFYIDLQVNVLEMQYLLLEKSLTYFAPLSTEVERLDKPWCSHMQTLGPVDLISA